LSTTPLASLPLADRDVRQRQIVPPDKLAACHAVVVGVGAVGRQVAVQLAAIGVSHLTLVDHDTVCVENLAPQAYWPSDLGQPKVLATAALCRQIHPDCRIEEVNERFRRSMVKSIAAFTDIDARPIVFACVDSIATRGLIWEAVKKPSSFFADGRMSAEVVRVLAAEQPGSDSYYPTTLFAAAEAHAGACTAKSTVYTASVAAGLMLGQFTKWLRGLPVERDVVLNLLSAELVAR
jgi:molybdopterin/thiamine biosynthesis adenylyltransferase